MFVEESSKFKEISDRFACFSDRFAILPPCKSTVFLLLSLYDTESTINTSFLLAWEVQKMGGGDPPRRLFWHYFLSFKPLAGPGAKS